MDDQINFTLERIPKATREVTFSDGSVMKITAPAYMLEEMDTEEETDVTSGDEISNTTVLPPAIAESPIHTDTSVSNSEQPTIEMLTAEIKMYLHIANQSIIEVGKRLIQAKELVPHGEWQKWLKDNFNLSYRMAAKFIQIAERFGKNQPNSNVPTSAHFDISTFKPSTLVELLALPEGDEQKFIAEKAAEGNPADQMSVKQLRAEVKKWKDKFASSEKSNQGLESYIAILRNEMVYYRKELDTTKDHARALSKQLAQQKTVEVPPPDYEDLQREVKELRNRPIDVATEFPADYESTKQKLAQMEADADSFRQTFATKFSLQQFLKTVPDLINSDNLQSVVYSCAVDNLQLFEYQLSQLSTFISLLQQHLNSWKDDPANKFPIDRNSITQELMNICLVDSTKSISKQFRQLILNLGFNEVNEIPDYMLPDILKKARTFIP